MYGHHHACRLSIAAGLALAITYTIGALVVVYAPERLLAMAAPLHYMNSLQQFAGQMSLNWMAYISGVIQTFVYTAFVVYLVCILYRYLGGKEEGKGGCR